MLSHSILPVTLLRASVNSLFYRIIIMNKVHRKVDYGAYTPIGSYIHCSQSNIQWWVGGGIFV